jgi:hypothetical protein
MRSIPTPAATTPVTRNRFLAGNASFPFCSQFRTSFQFRSGCIKPRLQPEVYPIIHIERALIGVPEQCFAAVLFPSLLLIIFWKD